MLHISLPDQLPDGGFHVRLDMPGLPEESFIVKAYFNPPDQGEVMAHLATTFSIYGRGSGSGAKEKPRIYIPVDANLFKAFGKGKGNSLVLRAETPAGEPYRLDSTGFSAPAIEPF